MLLLTLLGLLFITLIPATTALVGRFPGEKLAIACFSANSFLHALTSGIFWIYVMRKQKQFAANSDPRLLTITAQVWFVISLGWLISIPLGYVNVNIAYVTWVAWPNLVAAWAKYERRKIQTVESLEHRQKIRNKKK